MKFIIQGGWQFMVPLLVLLIIVILLTIKGLKNNTEKNIDLIKEISLFSLIFGVLGFTTGLLGALEAIEIATSVSASVLAGGFKIGLLAPFFGLIIFLIGRLSVIFLIWKSTKPIK